MLERVEAPVLNGLELAPGRVGQQRALQRGHGVRGVAALEHGEDIVRLCLDYGLEAQILKQGGVRVRHVHAAEPGEHLAEHVAFAALDLAAHAGGAYDKHGRRAAVCTGHGGVYLFLDVEAVSGVVFPVPGELGADVQHVQIVVKALNVKIRNGYTGRFEHVLQLEVSACVHACQYEVRLGGEQGFERGGLYRAEIGDCVVETQIEARPGVVCRGGQAVLAAGEAPHVGEGTDKGGDTLGLLGSRDRAP